jgi:hypothetical protein
VRDGPRPTLNRLLAIRFIERELTVSNKAKPNEANAINSASCSDTGA